MDQTVFEARRHDALSRMGSGALVVFGARGALRNNDVEHQYRQDSDFYYLTGLEDPGAALVLTSSDPPTYALFVTEQDPKHVAWDGPKVTIDRAKEAFGASVAHPMPELIAKLGELLVGHERVYFELGKNEQDDHRFIRGLKRARQLARRTGRAPDTILDVVGVLHEMRRIKDSTEAECMRKANALAQRAHLAAMAGAAAGRFEYELRAVLENEFMLGGSHRAAYQTIVGSGPNATILHYIDNRRRMEDDDLVLIDAGCELDFYASDITRTFPVSGRFSDPQRRIYEIVLDAQLAAIEAVKPGATFGSVHSVALRIITQGLIDLGFIAGPVEEAIEEKRHKPYFMHKTGHYLGMDVHDVGPYHDGDKPRAFEPGVVITVEPGIYIGTDNKDVPAEYRGIGVRIEDDVLVTEAGYENLSLDLPKSVDEVERACGAS